MSVNIPNEVQAYLSSYKYKLELHVHTAPVSPCGQLSSKEAIERLKSKNYDLAVITNHFCSSGSFMQTDDPVATFLADYYEAFEVGEKLGVRVLLGAEYRFNESPNEYLVFGADEALLRETVSRFDMTYEQFYKEYRSDDLFILQAHPFRNGLTQEAPDLVDGIEAFNMHPHHNSRVALAKRYADENGIPIITAGNDLHNPGYEGLCATRTRTLPENSKELIAILKSKDYLMEISGCPLLPYASF